MTTSPEVIDAPRATAPTNPRIAADARHRRTRRDARVVRPPRVLGRPRDRRGVLHLRVHAARARRWLLRNTTLTGGDTGAHVWFPATCATTCCRWRLAGWSPDFYAGFPAGQFYFPFPALLIVAPRRRPAVQHRVQARHRGSDRCCCRSARTCSPAASARRVPPRRCSRWPPPPSCSSRTAATRRMTFDLHIMGGTLASTFAGEYSFMIALALSLLLPGHARARARPARSAVAARGAARGHAHQPPRGRDLRGDRRPWCIWLTHRPIATSRASWPSARWGCCSPRCGWCPSRRRSSTRPTCATSRSASAPDSRRTSTGCSSRENWFLYPLALRRDRCRDLVPAAVHARRRRASRWRPGLAFYNWEGLRDVLGKAPAWNLRLLPFWYLMLYLLAAVGVAEHAPARARRAVGDPGRGRETTRRSTPRSRSDRRASPSPTRTCARRRPQRRSRTPPSPRTTSRGAADRDPRRRAARWRGSSRSRCSRRSWRRSGSGACTADARLPALLGQVQLHRLRGRHHADFTKKSWPEYRAFMDTANSLPPRAHGVGGRRRHRRVRHAARADAAAVLDPRPHPVDGGPLLRGVGDDAVPLHDDRRRSRSRRRTRCGACPYRSIADFDLGVRYLQLMGVRYYAAFTDAGEAGRGEEPAAAAGRDRARPRRQAAERVEHLPGRRLADRRAARSTEPVVVDDLHAAAQSGSARASRRRPAGLGRRPSSARGSARRCRGSTTRPRSTARSPTAARRRGSARRRGQGAHGREASRCPRSRSRTSARPTSSVSFDVSRTGVPVMVKTSYYPNWEVEGAERAVAGHAQLHGGRAHEQAREAHVRRPRTADWAGPGA